ncbi:MAG: FHA domain-containing protein [Anaerolineae bacterium]
MMKCPACQAGYVENTVFCSECGHYLPKQKKLKTNPLQSSGGEAEVQPDPGPFAIRLKIQGENSREVEMPLNKITHIGRVDPVLTVFPDLDLSDDEAVAKSVSRRHASILIEGETIIVKDLGSVNGTFINGKRLQPYLSGPLKDGDILQLGRVMIEVSFSR